MSLLPHIKLLKKKNENVVTSDGGTQFSGTDPIWGRARFMAKSFVILLLGLFFPIHQAQAFVVAIPFLIKGAIWGAVAVGGWLAAKAAIAPAVMTLFLWVAELIEKIALIFMTAMAYLLDQSIGFTITSDVYKSVSAIEVGWTAVRDISNMFFIFVLLYIAILTILGMAGSSTKRWVAHLVIAALLINFSLFVTQVVVDAGNVLAVGFWNKMMIKDKTGAEGPSAAGFFFEAFRVQTQASAMKDPSTGATLSVPEPQQILIYLGSAAVNFVAGYVFLAGAIMMIIRTVTIMVLMIASPFAFLGFALPKGGGFASQWLDKLIGVTFMAPAFVFMLYIDSLVIRGAELIKMTGADKAKWSEALSGMPVSFAIIFNFILMITLLLAALKVAHKVGGDVGKSAGSYAKLALGGAAATTAAAGGLYYRRSAGRRAQKELDNPELHKLALKPIGDKQGDAARRRIASLTKVANSTGDFRNTSVGKGITSVLAKVGVSTGGPQGKSFADRTKVGGAYGNYAGKVAQSDKEIIDEAKKIYPDNPIAQKAYIESKMGKAWTDTQRNRKASDTLNREAGKKLADEKDKSTLQTMVDQSKALEKEKRELDALNNKINNGETGLDASVIKAKDNIAKITSGFAAIEKDAQQAMLRMSGEDVAKLLEKPEYRNSKSFMSGMTAKDYSSMNKRFYEGGYSGTIKDTDGKVLDHGKVISDITKQALMDEKTPDYVRRAIKNAQKNGTSPYNPNLEEEIANIVSSGKDPNGNFKPKGAPLPPAEQKQLDEYFTMLDNDDIADFHESLLTNPALVAKYSSKTIDAIERKIKNDGGTMTQAQLAAFLSAVDNAQPTGNTPDEIKKAELRIERVKESINKRSRNDTSAFYQEQVLNDRGEGKQRSPLVTDAMINEAEKENVDMSRRANEANKNKADTEAEASKKWQDEFVNRK